MSDVVMRQLLAMRYQLQAMDQQLEALMKLDSGVETVDCEHINRLTLPSIGMAERWQCAKCGYTYDEAAELENAALEEVDAEY